MSLLAPAGARWLIEGDTDAYSQFGAMRAGFDTYRAFRQDRTDFREHMGKNPKLKMPVLAAAGDACFFAEVSSQSVKCKAWN